MRASARPPAADAHVVRRLPPISHDQTWICDYWLSCASMFAPARHANAGRTVRAFPASTRLLVGGPSARDDRKYSCAAFVRPRWSPLAQF